MNIKTRISNLLTIINEDIVEKEHIMSMAMLCAISGESIFLLGSPGTAKSMIARRLKLVLKNAKSFEYIESIKV